MSKLSDAEKTVCALADDVNRSFQIEHPILDMKNTIEKLGGRLIVREYPDEGRKYLPNLFEYNWEYPFIIKRNDSFDLN